MRVVDLFSGCGGLSLGFEKAGFEVVAAFDNWKEACAVYAVNFKHPVFERDLSALSDTQFIKNYCPDILIGGPPCQDFSSAGKRDETLGRADLTLSFASIVADVQPEWFVMENVERIQTSCALQKAISLLKSCGYGLSQVVLQASYCGVPQSRKRFFMVGHMGTDDHFLDGYFEKNLAKKPMTVYEYLGDTLPLEHYYRHPRSYARRAIYSVHEPSATIRGVNRPVPPNYQPHAGDTCEPSPALRPLTTKERSLIQTFPEMFRWVGSKTHTEQLIGNAVPVNLAWYVANCIQAYIADPTQAGTNAPDAVGQLELFA